MVMQTERVTMSRARKANAGGNLDARRRLPSVDRLLNAPPVAALAEIAAAHDTWLMTDDAHGVGVVGGGRGSSFVGGDKAEVPLQMGTLSKAVGSYGGYLCAAQPVIDLIRTRARPFIYSTGLPPGAVAASIAALDLIANDPDLVYVAALGHAFGPNPERGVYRSRDGGRNWEKVLYRSPKAGAVDLAMDPNNPRLLYASIWETYRNFWSLSSGGPDSGLFKSTDGGDTWTEISDNEGLPKGIKGKIGVAVSPAQADRVWAIVESEQEGLYRSDDGGRKWQRVSDNRDLIHRPWYYCHVFADPCHADTVYVTNLKMWKSTDGGRRFEQVTTPHGDNHDLWIDPKDPRHLVQGNDGGACVSFNGGRSWSNIYNQLTAQLYRMDIDTQFPYRF